MLLLCPSRTGSGPGLTDENRARVEQLEALPLDVLLGLRAGLGGDDRHVATTGGGDLQPSALEQRVTPGFLEAMGTRLVAGRSIDARDSAICA